ncbi:hypothetical protein FJT64_009327 [Amphibalanus amphitrite]|uniref:Gustatory receptor n=1 Tax=Amphibalanus amphitrite TaxID=1232801 RepID=A0A6A4VRL7_AMPAM|nr:hypothetical protein FJT64_009327 [Amphibalanus amphitrite]
MTGERRHSTLLRLSLGTCGVLTLTGLHQLSPGRAWRLATALPLGCFIVLLLSAAASYLLELHTIWEALVASNVLNFLLKSGIVLVTFVAQRAGLRRLQAQLETLEGRAGPRAAGAGMLDQLQAVFFWTLAITFLVLWIFYERATSHEHENHYFVISWASEVLNSPPWTYARYGFQLFVLFIGTCFMGAFDSCYFLWMKAAVFHLRVIRSTLQECCQSRATDDVEAGAVPKTAARVDGHRSWTGDGKSVTGTDGAPSANWRLKLWSGAVGDQKVTPGATLLLTAPAIKTLHDPSGQHDGGDISATTLQELSDYYDDVCRYVTSVNQVTGLPSFVVHASTLMNILLDCYLVLRQVLHLDGANTAHVLSYSLELCLFVYRLSAYSLGGDAVSQESVALRRQLLDVPWRRLTAQTSRQRDELLSKLQMPLAVVPLGFFTMKKGNLLSMTGLFLTYFVIIIQMVQMAGVDKSQHP